jgi:uncharacterized RDD family membrane protein YckC
VPFYSAYFHATERGQTPGKRTVGIAVRDQNTLGRITFARALGRAYIVWVFVLIGFFGFIPQA